MQVLCADGAPSQSRSKRGSSVPLGPSTTCSKAPSFAAGFSHLLDRVLVPQSVAVTERGDAALGGDASARQHQHVGVATKIDGVHGALDCGCATLLTRIAGAAGRRCDGVGGSELVGWGRPSLAGGPPFPLKPAPNELALPPA
jgi:hypothetical protein